MQKRIKSQPLLISFSYNNEIIDEVIEEVVDEILPDGETGEEIISELEAPVIDETQVIEEAPTDETSTVEEQAVTLSEESISNQDGAGENDSEGNIEVISDGSVTIDSGGDGTSESGSSGDTITE